MKKHIVIGGLLMISTLVHPVMAAERISPKESAILLKVSDEITYLRNLLDKAEAAESKGAKIRLNYDNLNADLKDIQDALARHVNAPQRSPRSINPLTKRYTR